MSNLVPLPPGRSDLLAAVPAESVWLANFTSERTKRTYRDAIARFIAFHGISSTEELRRITPAHVIAWRDAMLGKGDAPRTVHTRLSSVSSLRNVSTTMRQPVW